MQDPEIDKYFRDAYKNPDKDSFFFIQNGPHTKKFERIKELTNLKETRKFMAYRNNG